MNASDPVTTERRSRLFGVALRTIVADQASSPVEEPSPFPGGAALVHDDAAWVLIDGPADRALGGALAWALRHDATSLHLVASAHTGLLARRAERFHFPITVWFREDRALVPAIAEPLTPPPVPSGEHLALVGIIEAAGAVANVEHGVVFGEVRGLEVCRVVDEPTLGRLAEISDGELAAANGPGGVQLEVGVGINDREAFRIIHGEIPTVEALRAVVASVDALRHAGAPQHPLNRLAQERFLRWRLEQQPGLVGMASVAPAQPPAPRPNLKDATPCVALGTTPGGTTAAIVCTHGVDLDLVGFVADVRLATGAPVVVAAPARDVLPIAADLLGLLADPVTVVPIDV